MNQKRTSSQRAARPQGWRLTTALISAVLFASALAAGVRPFQEPQQPVQPQQPGQPQAPPLPKPEKGNPITTARQALENSRSESESPTLTIDPIPDQKVSVNNQVTFQVFARDSTLKEGVMVTYQMISPPAGATLDPKSGIFSWTPTMAGSYQFFIGAADNSTPPRVASTPVTIVVNAELEVFGRRFFDPARALIQWRLQLMRNGFNPVPAPSATAPEAAPVGSQNPNLPGVQFPQPGIQLPQNLAVPGRASANEPVIPTADQAAASALSGMENGQPNSPYAFQEKTNREMSSAGESKAGAAEREKLNAVEANRLAQSQYAAPLPNIGQELASAGQYPNLPSNVAQPQGGQQAAQSWNLSALQTFVGPYDQTYFNPFVISPDRYELGPGDILVLRYWSTYQNPKEVPLTVDERGDVILPDVGIKLTVRGQTLDKAESMIRDAMRGVIKGANLTLTLKQLRTMSITVLGAAYEPGTFQVPAVATLFNALYMFGGPDDSGSLRSIELRRTGEAPKRFDLYKFLIYGDKSSDVPLEPGDTIYFPPAGAQVVVKGDVRRPAVYEMLPGETLKSALDFAGGPKATAVAENISLETEKPGVGRILRDIDLKAGGPDSDAPVYDGDVITVSSVRDQYVNQITVKGAVDQPGLYAYTQGMTVADVIQHARGLLPEAYTQQANLLRQNPDKTTTLIRVDLQQALQHDPNANVQLQPFDTLQVFAQNEVAAMGTREVSIKGAVSKPGDYYRSDQERLSDLILQAGGPALNAAPSALFVQRVGPDGVVGPLQTLDLNRVLAHDPTQNILLQDNDIVILQSVEEARYLPPQTVQIQGAVQRPGEFYNGKGMRLSDLISLAGGVLPNASQELEITHARVPIDTPRTKVPLAGVLAKDPNADMPLLDGDVVTLDTNGDIQLTPMTVRILGAVKSPGPYPINGRTDTLSELIRRAGGFAKDAFPQGAQFFRNPSLLESPSQNDISPAIEDALRVVNQDDYQRASAEAEADEIRFIKGAGSTTTAAIPLPGATQAQTTQATPEIPPQLLDKQIVTPARPLDESELTPGGDINVNLPLAIRKPGTRDDMVLKDGDIVIIPDTPTTVSVVGAVTVPSAVLYVPGKRLSYYLKLAGGETEDAARDRVMVLTMGGLVARADNRTPIHVGDIVWVPTKVMATRLADKTDQVSQIAGTVTSGAILLALLRAIL